MNFRIIFLLIPIVFLGGCPSSGDSDEPRPPSIDVRVGNCDTGAICSGWTRNEKQCTIVDNRFNEVKEIELLKSSYTRSSPDPRVTATNNENDKIKVTLKAKDKLSLPIIEPNDCPSVGGNLEYTCYFKIDEPNEAIDVVKKLVKMDLNSALIYL